MVTFDEHMAYLREIGYDLDFRDLYKFHRDVWITRNHDEFIHITDMSTGHIRNILRLIEHNDRTCCYGLGPVWAPKLEQELERRGNYGA